MLLFILKDRMELIRSMFILLGIPKHKYVYLILFFFKKTIDINEALWDS